jgi:hypothetical protein
MKFPAIPVAKDRRIVEYDLAAAQTFVKGAAVVLNASEEVAECGADPAVVLGFAAEPAGSNPESASKVLVCLAEGNRRFWIEGDNAPTMDDVNQTYGLAKDADGYWYVDGSESGALSCYVHTVDTERDLYEISILETVAQISVAVHTAP